MTENEWLTSTDPLAMLGLRIAGPKLSLRKLSDRKSRLFAVACWRSSMPPTNPAFFLALDELEELADKKREGFSAEALQYICSHYVVADLLRMLAEDLWETTWPENEKLRMRRQQHKVTSAAILRDIVGNPYRPSAVKAVRAFGGLMRVDWLTTPVADFAEHIYKQRDYAAMPVLADMLQDHGCENEDMLRHCRGMSDNDPTPWEYRERADNDVSRMEAEMHVRLNGPQHVRGCWVLDLLTGRQ